MKKIITTLGIAMMLLMTTTAFAGGYVDQKEIKAKIVQFSIQNNAVWVQVDIPVNEIQSKSSCKTSGFGLKTDSPYFKENFSILLSYKLAGKEIGLRHNNTPNQDGHCEIVFVRAL